MRSTHSRPLVPEAGSVAERIVDATLRCVARWGLAKTTVEDVAREAGVGRATLYRLFPGGRDALIEAVVAAETGRFLATLDSRLAGAQSLEDVLVVGVSSASATLASHEALQFLLAHEPETILPHLAFGQMDGVLRTIAGLVGPYLAPWIPSVEEAARGAEWVTRVVISYCTAPSGDVDLADPESARRFIRTYVIPGLVPGQLTAV